MDAGQRGGVAQALEAALTDVEATLQPRDGAMVELARTLAAGIDAYPSDMAKLAPQLANVLDALLMSPRARASVTRKGVTPDGPHLDSVDELRQRRSARQHGTTAVDSAAP